MINSGWVSAKLLLPVATGLSLYSVGAGAMEGFVAYPSWREVGAEEFVAFHGVTDTRVVGTLVAPFAIATAAMASLAVLPPTGVPRWLPVAAIAAQSVTWVSTIAVEVPIQRLLTQHGYSRSLIDGLVRVDRMTRQAPNALLVLLSFAMIAKAARSASRAGR